MFSFVAAILSCFIHWKIRYLTDRQTTSASIRGFLVKFNPRTANSNSKEWEPDDTTDRWAWFEGNRFIPCECVRVCMGQMGWCFKPRCKNMHNICQISGSTAPFKLRQHQIVRLNNIWTISWMPKWSQVYQELQTRYEIQLKSFMIPATNILQWDMAFKKHQKMPIQ